jgi:hypothetical protein
MEMPGSGNFRRHRLFESRPGLLREHAIVENTGEMKDAAKRALPAISASTRRRRFWRCPAITTHPSGPGGPRQRHPLRREGSASDD